MKDYSKEIAFYLSGSTLHDCYNPNCPAVIEATQAINQFLQDAQRVEGEQARVNTLYEAADLVCAFPEAYRLIWLRRQELLKTLQHSREPATWPIEPDNKRTIKP